MITGAARPTGAVEPETQKVAAGCKDTMVFYLSDAVYAVRTERRGTRSVRHACAANVTAQATENAEPPPCRAH